MNFYANYTQDWKSKQKKNRLLASIGTTGTLEF